MAIRSDSAGVEKSYLLDMLATDAGDILEIGCGDGRLMWPIAACAARIFGVDLPATLPSVESRARSKHIHFAAASGVQLPFRHSCFGQAVFGLSL